MKLCGRFDLSFSFPMIDFKILYITFFIFNTISIFMYIFLGWLVEFELK